MSSLALLYQLAQAEVFPALIAEAVPIFGQDHHCFDVCELFERSSNFRLHARICADAARVEAAAELQGGRPSLRCFTSHVQRDEEVWSPDRQRCSTVRRATQHGIQFREVASMLFGEGWPGDQELDREGRHGDRWRRAINGKNGGGIRLQRFGGPGEEHFDRITCARRGCRCLGVRGSIGRGNQISAAPAQDKNERHKQTDHYEMR